MREASIERKTTETNVQVKLNLDGKGESEIDIGIGFLTHMLNLFAKHGIFDLKIKAEGDLEVDEHHTVEDIGIVLGQAFKEALGDKLGINRYGYFILPMDETLALASVDISGRAYSVVNISFSREKIGDLSTELITDFFEAFARNLGASIHIKVFYGRNDHHKAEAVFKAFSKAMNIATRLESRITGKMPSTKGRLDG